MIRPHRILFIVPLVSTLLCPSPLTVLAQSAERQHAQAKVQTQERPPADSKQAEAEAPELIKEVYALYRQGRFDEALPICARGAVVPPRVGDRAADRRALALREKVFKHLHPSVASSMNSLAGLALLGGKYAEAEALYREA